MTFKRLGTLLSCSVLGAGHMTALAQPSSQDMWRIIQQQNAQIEALNEQLRETEAKVDATAEAVEDGGLQSAAQWINNTSLGMYGELHYNNLTRDNNTSSKDELDLHRFVLFIGHQFSDTVKVFTELEVEHSLAGEGKEGEVEVEQAFIQWDYTPGQYASAGLFLLPVGILNETHEPDTFYGVERNNVEKNIIPTTWWEGGIAAGGEIAEGLHYDVAMHSGLFLDPSEPESAVRSGRQKVSESKADSFAYTARLKYTAIPGVELAATVQHQTDVLQAEEFVSGTGAIVKDVSALFYEAHAVVQKGPFGFRALYAAWDFDGGMNVIAEGADEQEGFYVEPSYKITNNVGVFARYSEWDNRAGSAADTQVDQTDVGVNWWLTDTVVLKADYQDQSAANSAGDDGFNLGVGWSF